MKKPDRFERMARKLYIAERGRPWQWNEARATLMISALLRREYAWMVGVIRKYQKSINGFRGELSEEFLNGYNQACEEFYARLQQRRK